MRKNILLIIFVILMACMFGCASDDKSNKVKVYEDTEETAIVHEEAYLTAVITNIDLERNIIGFKECISGNAYELIYNGGVSITNTYGDYISISEVSCGSVVDVVYYSDTNKLVSIAQNSSTKVLKQVNKFTVDLEKQKATYKGTSCPLSEFVTAYDNGEPIDIREVNQEDQVTLNIFGGKLVSVIIDVGHGYVRLKNQDSYVGGMVEIGYDVIVPVTTDMLVAVREGEYTLRVSRGGYNASKQVYVYKDRESVVDLSDISIPMGTAVFEVTPADAEIYVNGDKITGYTYSNVYGSYKLKITAEGYKSFSGSFELSEPVKTFTINLSATDPKDDASTEDKTEASTAASTTGTGSATESGGSDNTSTTMSATNVTASTTEATTGGTGSSSSSDNTTSTSTADTTQSGQATNNKITIKEPAGVSVYVDGDYVGIAPVSFTKVVGTHTITLYKTGYLIKSYTIQAKDNGKDDEYSFAGLTSLLDLVE